MSKKTLVIGASENPYRYAYRAVNMLQEHKHEVLALGREKGAINGTQILLERPADEAVDTVTLYIRPEIQPQYYTYLLEELKPKRIIFNPGTENPELYEKARQKGIEVIEACTLVMLSTDQY